LRTITRYSPAAQQQLIHRLSVSLGNIEKAAQITAFAMCELDDVYTYSVQEVALALQTADEMLQAARFAQLVTDDMEASIARYTEAYLADMLHITHEAGKQVTAILLSH
jgi:hypothetical protein